ncbi:hypothetical protein GGR34_002621 [Microvirga flocculans]|uniref:Uncharacterized protein n=1 Tax=Microvirga flocculans TaxID=217168 RepID=A0A7W6IGC3_9HYPH|nr:hypothetical protein [Microvirga flocculans]MBB4040962.1 hypothetical protein [Microvirga flocculans]
MNDALLKEGSIGSTSKVKIHFSRPMLQGVPAAGKGARAGVSGNAQAKALPQVSAAGLEARLNAGVCQYVQT